MEAAVICEINGDQSIIHVHDLSTGIRLKAFKNCSCGKNGLDFVGNDYVVAAQYKKQLIHFYDSQNTRLVSKIACPQNISCLSISPCGNYCVVALIEKIYIWQICTGNLINVLSKHFQNISCIKFSTDGLFFVTCGDDNLVIIWNFLNALQPRDVFSDSSICDEPIHSLTCHSMPIESMYIGINGSRSCLVTCSLDQTCKMFDIVTGRNLCTFVFDNGCTAVTMDLMERNLFVATLNGTVYFLNTHSQPNKLEMHINSRESINIKAHEKLVNSLAVTFDGQTLVSGSVDGTVKLWNIHNHQRLKIFSYKGEVSNVILRMYNATFEQNVQSCTKCNIAKFKRTEFVPGKYGGKFNAENLDDEEMAIVSLRKVEKNDSFNFARNHQLSDESFIAKMRMQYLSQRTANCFSEPKNASHAELIEGITHLGAMAKELYSFSSDKLLAEIKDKAL